MMYSDAKLSTNEKKRKKVRIQGLIEMKKNAQKISAVTCYDASFARLIEQTNVDFVLVGDSLGNVIQGKNSTLPVTLQEIAYHIKCVRQALNTPLLVADMPFLTAGVSTKETMKNAGLLLQAGAEAVKIEGASPELCKQINYLTRHGIPVMGHIGLMPQSVHALGGYRVQGKTEVDKKRLLKEAKLLQDAGCFALVLELISPNLSVELTKILKIPTIGIGSGNACDGNILVLQDMLGMNKQFRPKFLRHYLELEDSIVASLNQYCSDVKLGKSENE